MLFNLFKIILTVVEVIVCLLLVAAILIQKSKQQGAGLAFGSGMGETLFGGQIGNVMTKVTVVLAIVFLVNTLALTFMTVKSKNRRPVKAAPPAAMPAGGPGSTAPAGMPDQDTGPGMAVEGMPPALPQE